MTSSMLGMRLGLHWPHPSPPKSWGQFRGLEAACKRWLLVRVWPGILECHFLPFKWEFKTFAALMVYLRYWTICLFVSFFTFSLCLSIPTIGTHQSTDIISQWSLDWVTLKQILKKCFYLIDLNDSSSMGGLLWVIRIILLYQSILYYNGKVWRRGIQQIFTMSR